METKTQSAEKRLLNLQYLTARYAFRAIKQSISRARLHQTTGDWSTDESDEKFSRKEQSKQFDTLICLFKLLVQIN